jgi:hypothetical protein
LHGGDRLALEGPGRVAPERHRERREQAVVGDELGPQHVGPAAAAFGIDAEPDPPADRHGPMEAGEEAERPGVLCLRRTRDQHGGGDEAAEGSAWEALPLLGDGEAAGLRDGGAQLRFVVERGRQRPRFTSSSFGAGGRLSYL